MRGNFSLFPTKLLSLNLTGTELRVLVALYSFRGKNTDTVWPSLEALAGRAGIKDCSRISKITKRLAEKGCLQKKKSGFSGNNRYMLIVPEENTNLDESTNIDKSTNDIPANLDESSKIDESTKSNLDESTKSNLDESTKSNKHTNELTIKQTKKNMTAQDIVSEFPGDVELQTAQDYLTNRKATKSPLTVTAWSRMKPQILIAMREHGLSANAVLAEAVEAGWRGFKAHWLTRRLAENRPPSRASPSTDTFDRLTDRTWADGINQT